MRQILSQRPLRTFLFCQTVSSGSQSLWVSALAWQIYEVTGQAAHLGGLGLTQFAGTFAFSLLGGAVADARDRSHIMATHLALFALAAGLLAWATAGGWVGPWGIYAAALVTASAAAFGNPASSALLPTLVPPESFAVAVTLSSTLRQVARLSGPVVFGGVSAQLGTEAAYTMACGATALGAVLVWGVRPRYGGLGRRAVSARSILEGLQFLRRRPVLLGAMSLDMVAVIFAGALAVLPIYAKDILGVGPGGYGVLAAALDAGTVAMAVVLMGMPPIQRAGRALLIAVGVFGLATIVFGLSRSYALSLLALMVAGMADQVSMVARSLIIQLSTPDALRGRVNSVNLLFIGASNQLGAAESGYLAAATSAPFSVTFGGFACLAALAGALRWVPSLAAYRAEPPAPPSAPRAEPAGG